MTTRITVESSVLEWAVKKSNIKFDEVVKKFPKYNEWVAGTVFPTYNQLVSFSSFTKIPFGYFMLKEPPVETLPLVEFRTIDTEQIGEPSRELVDTIKDMENKQEWMRNYLIDQGYTPNTIVSSIKFSDSLGSLEVATDIRNKVGLKFDWYRHTNSRIESYDYLKRILSENGILIMQNGTALGNTHRQLDINEFRAFALVDEYAPLIFINIKDTASGKTFSILHELVHIILGVDSLYNKPFYNQYLKSEDKVEILCNSVAAELLVPTSDFIDKWRSNFTISRSIENTVTLLSEWYKISQVVIARKALDNNFISQVSYNKISDECKIQAIKSLNKQKKSGGNPVNNAQSRLDHKFVYALSSSLNNGSAVYSDIYKLTGLSRRVFEQVEYKLWGRA